MARIVLCPDFEHFTHLSQGMLRVMQFSANHGYSTYLLMSAIAGEAGEATADAFLDALWNTNPDRAEVLTAIMELEDLLDGLSSGNQLLAGSSRLHSAEVDTGARWLRARLQELRKGLL